MNCKDAINGMHDYFDGDLDHAVASRLKEHIRQCPACRQHFAKMEQAEALVLSMPKLGAPDRLTQAIMQNIPKETKKNRWLLWAKRHPSLVASVVFLVMAATGLSIFWEQDTQLVVRGSDLHLQIQGDQVIIPEGQIVTGNLVVENGKLLVDGEIQGNLTVIDGSVQLASSAMVAGEVTEIDQALDWIWYKIQDWFAFLR